jgi:hypothetical protein
MGELDSWAVVEFGEADLGDPRRTQRLVQLATVLGSMPGGSLPTAAGDKATAKAAYRFFDNDHIEPGQILQGHVLATLERLAQHKLVLVANDTMFINLSAHPQTEGLGPIGSSSTLRGMVMHGSLAFDPQGLALGLLEVQMWQRQEPTLKEQGRDVKKLDIEDKESVKWLRSLRAINEAAEQCPQTQFLQMGERESDVYDLFLERRAQNVELLVRASQDRAVQELGHYLWKAMSHKPVAARVTLQVPRRKEQRARKAHLTVRCGPVTLWPPKHRDGEKLPKVKLWALWAIERNPPANTEPLEWMLLSTTPILSPQEAVEALRHYTRRFGIELWHKVLKSGCRIEARQLATTERLQRCFALYCVIAWRILYATWLARELPDAPCTILLEEDEWKALYCTTYQTPHVPLDPPALRDAVRWVAQLGGFLGRKSDKEPGITSLWRGFQRLADLTTMYVILHSHRGT